MCRPVVSGGTDDTGNDESTASHTKPTGHENGFLSEAINRENGRACCKGRGRQGTWPHLQPQLKEGGGVACETESLEDKRCIVHDSIHLAEALAYTASPAESPETPHSTAERP